jgi:hypothetical protein
VEAKQAKKKSKNMYIVALLLQTGIRQRFDQSIQE